MNQTIVLATVGIDGIPDLRTLGGFGISDYVIYFSTNKNSNKVLQIANKKEVSLLFQHENQFISKFFNVTIYGEAVLLDNEVEFKKGKELIIGRKPFLKITKATHNIYKVVPKKIKALDFEEKNLSERVTLIEL